MVQWRFVGPLLAGLVLMGLALAWQADQPDPRPGLLRLKNVGLGHLENEKWDQAEPVFRQLVQALPEEPLPWRDLTVTLAGLVQLQDSKRLGVSSAMARLRAAAARLLEVDDTAGAHHLAGRVWAEVANRSRAHEDELGHALNQARAHFQRAAALEPNDPAPLWSLVLLERDFASSEIPTDRQLADLRGALRRAPDNLFAAKELARTLALAERPELADAVASLLPLVPGDAAEVRAKLTRAHEALRQRPQPPPPAVCGQVQEACNVLGNHPAARQDARRLQPHLLAFVLTDFRPGFYAHLPPEIEGAIPVRFDPGPVRDAGPGPAVTTALREDLNGTGAFATVAVRPGPATTRVEVWPTPPDEGLPPLEVPGTYPQAALADLDLDIQPPPQDAPPGTPNTPADLDLILYGPSGVRVLENRAADGQRRWVDRTADAKIPPMSGVRWLLVHDVDHDGNLDLVVGLEKGVRVLRNLGAWAFEDVTARSEGLADLVTVAAVAGDFDGDGDSDLLCLTPGGTLTFLENLRGGRLRARADGPGFGRVHCLAMADLNNDGRPDLLLGLDTGVLVLLADPAQRLPLGARRLLLPTGAPVRQAGAFDHDNDGWQDVWAATDAAPRPLRLFRNLRGQRFDEVTDRLPELAGPILGVAAQDADGDGGLDLLLTRPDGVAPLHNVGANRNHWLALRLRAVLNTDEAGGGQAAKANYLNLGGTLEVSAGQLYQWRQVAGSVTHFGLGARPAAELARVVWTNGVPQDLVRPAVDRALTEPQRPKGSCPFLFAWDGAKFVMVTDCLWTSALGMQLAHGVFMPHDRQENYLVITDDQLRPRGGHYELRFTNELWEVPYLDQAELWVVEHPADVAIVTNQRIAPGQPPFKLHTVRDRRTPLTAVDHRGRDVLPEVRRADGRVAGGLTRKRYVGLTEPHWLELGLGDLRGAKRLTLYLAGWIWPTDTTANVAISQDPRFRGPTGVIGGTQAPVLQVPDGRGGWVTAVPDMGFPSGKLQTVAVPVPLDRFPADDYRVRIATAMELYWDEVYFTVDEPEVPVTIRKLPAAAADLRYRGYSRPYQDTPTGPHLFDYEDVDPRPIWLPRPGPYTRYGPVAELLARPDNRYVVMSPGDELALRFAALPPPPPGRRHTFLFYANGWLKDFDMNGGSSEAAGPLPFDGMSTYPYRAPETYPRTPEGEAFLRDFMTRTVDGAAYAGRMHPARQGRPSPEEARRRGTAGD